ncbi:MAG TPA: hypothetical protein DCP28_35055 [Cytophagales bacterium]|nr:hypothetical protein [Cytophagales bacterium]
MFRHIPYPFDKGHYTFEGEPYVTDGIAFMLTEKEIKSITKRLHSYVAKQGGSVDYIQIFVNDKGDVVHAIAGLDEIWTEGSRPDHHCSDTPATPQPNFILKLAEEQLPDEYWG